MGSKGLSVSGHSIPGALGESRGLVTPLLVAAQLAATQDLSVFSPHSLGPSLAI